MNLNGELEYFYSLRRYDTKVIRKEMVRALMENGDIGITELKRKIESKEYLNCDDSFIPWDTYESCISKLEQAGILLRTPSKNEWKKGKKVHLSLIDKEKTTLKYLLGTLVTDNSSITKKPRPKKEEEKSNEERMEKLYQMILFLDVVDNNTHELCITEQELGRDILPLFHISPSELRIEYVIRKSSKNPIITMYEYISESCIRIWKQEYKSSTPQPKISREETGNANHANNIISTNRNHTSKPSWLQLRDILIKKDLAGSCTF